MKRKIAQSSCLDTGCVFKWRVREGKNTLGAVASIHFYANALQDPSSQESMCQGNLFANCFATSSSQNPVGNYSLTYTHEPPDAQSDGQPPCFHTGTRHSTVPAPQHGARCRQHSCHRITFGRSKHPNVLERWRKNKVTLKLPSNSRCFK